jgi:hypothetical protein
VWKHFKVLWKIRGSKNEAVNKHQADRVEQNDEFYYFYGQDDEIEKAKMGWACRLAQETTNAYNILVGNPRGPRPLWETEIRW